MTHDTPDTDPDDEQLRALINIARQNQALAHLAISFAGAATIAAEYGPLITAIGVFLAVYGLGYGLAPFIPSVRRVLNVFTSDVPKPIDRDLVEQATTGDTWRGDGR